MEGGRYVQAGNWDSINVVEVHEDAARKTATYKLTTAIMLAMGVTSGSDTNMSGSMTRQSELNNVAVTETKPHIAHIGRMIEDMENDIRSNLNEVYIKKTREILCSVRNLYDAPAAASSHVGALNAAVMGHGKTRKVDSEVLESV